MTPIPAIQAGTPPLDERDTDHGIPQEEWGKVFEECNEQLRQTIKWMEENKEQWAKQAGKREVAANSKPLPSSAGSSEPTPAGQPGTASTARKTSTMGWLDFSAK